MTDLQSLISKATEYCELGCPFMAKHWIKFEGKIYKICECHKRLLDDIKMDKILEELYEE